MKRVVAYCRVSTDKTDQLNSLESQKKYFNDYINRNKEWQLVQIYADEGITGTNTRKRKAFNKMIEDGETGLYDMIITKEISRFARNTLDSIYYTRKLKDKGIGVLFLNDNIFTLDADSELRLTIMSSIAQEESRKTSQRVKWGQKRRMEAGIAFGSSILGYDIKNGKLTINNHEAEVVRLIFKKYLEENKGVNTISKELENDGHLTKTGSKKWYGSSLYKILQNEKYCGDLLQKKTYTPDYLNHKSVINKGQEEFVLIQNNHQPIITREVFDRTQEEMKRRSVNKNEKHYKHSNRYVFSGKIECGICGYKYVGRRRKGSNGTIRKTWQCGQHAKYGALKINAQGQEIGCTNRMLSEEVIKRLFLADLEKIIEDKENVKNEVKAAVSKVLNETDTQTEINKALNKANAEIEKITDKKRRVIDLYFEGGISKTDLHNMNNYYDIHLKNLYENFEKLNNKKIDSPNQQTITEETNNIIDGLTSCTVFSDEVCRIMLDKIIVHNKGNIEIFYSNFVTQ